MEVLTYQEMRQEASEGGTIDHIYRDITAEDRYVFAESPDQWEPIGAELDAELGGDWMPMSDIAKLELYEIV